MMFFSIFFLSASSLFLLSCDQAPKSERNNSVQTETAAPEENKNKSDSSEASTYLGGCQIEAEKYREFSCTEHYSTDPDYDISTTRQLCEGFGTWLSTSEKCTNESLLHHCDKITEYEDNNGLKQTVTERQLDYSGEVTQEVCEKLAPTSQGDDDSANFSTEFRKY